MTLDRRRAADVFWNLATLMDDFALEVPFAELTADTLWSGCLPVGSRVCLPLTDDPPIAEMTDAAARIVAAGMRPVGVLDAPGPAEMRRFDQALGELAAVGVRECVLLWPATASLTEALDDVTRIIRRCDPGRRGYTDIGIGNVEHGALHGGHGAMSGGHELSAELLRGFEDASSACIDSGVGVTLLTPLVRSAECVVSWERWLRAAGNLFPLRARLPEVGRSPFRHTVPSLLDIAAAAEVDPGCLISDVQFVVRGLAGRTAEFADRIRRGNFVVEDTDYGYRLSMLRERKM